MKLDSICSTCGCLVAVSQLPMHVPDSILYNYLDNMFGSMHSCEMTCASKVWNTVCVLLYVFKAVDADCGG